MDFKETCGLKYTGFLSCFGDLFILLQLNFRSIKLIVKSTAIVIVIVNSIGVLEFKTRQDTYYFD